MPRLRRLGQRAALAAGERWGSGFSLRIIWLVRLEGNAEERSPLGWRMPWRVFTVGKHVAETYWFNREVDCRENVHL